MKLKRILPLVILFVFLLSSRVLAEKITLDGKFSDWKDKPIINDLRGDEEREDDVVEVRWFPDSETSNPYIYCERLEEGKKKDWESEAFLDGDFGKQKLQVSYNQQSEKVYLRLYDGRGHNIWNVNGKWGEDRSSGKKIEFYVPLRYLIKSTASGYEVKMHFLSDTDRVPDQDEVTISTISTFPVLTVLVGIVMAVGGFYIILQRKHRVKW